MVSRRILVAVVWVASLLVVAQWAGRAQTVPPPGFEVRFAQGAGKPGAPHGRLMANINGQWLPVTIDTLPLPDGNSR